MVLDLKDVSLVDRDVMGFLKQVSKEVFAALFPGAAEAAETFSYFQARTYLGSDSYDRIALANKIAGRQPTKFSTWARVNFPT